MHKKLYRYPKDGILFGIGSGIGKYFNVDPVFVRLAIVVLVLLTGVWPGLVLYIILFFIMPVEPSQQRVDREQSPKDVTPSASSGQTSDAEEPEVPEREEPVEKTERTEPVERMDSTQNM
jgi:phage shock protein PspC (stress-responsive transcriptional regulator)